MYFNVHVIPKPLVVIMIVHYSSSPQTFQLGGTWGVGKGKVPCEQQEHMLAQMELYVHTLTCCLHGLLWLGTPASQIIICIVTILFMIIH